MTPSVLSYDRMQRLHDILSRYAGLDRVELLVQESSGNTLRMELPTTVDARSMMLMAELKDLVDPEGSIVFV